MPLGCCYASSVWSPLLMPCIVACTPSEVCSSWKQSGLPSGLGYAPCGQYHFGYSNPPSRELVGAYPLFLLRKTLFRFIHKWACVFENLSLYLSLQLANIEARMGVGGSLYAKPIYLQPRAKLGKVFHSCNRFIHFLQKNFFRE